MKRLFVLLLVTVSFAGFGQNITNFMSENNRFLQDLNGNPIRLHSEYELDGTPYFSDYCNTTIKVAKGKLYKGMQAKLNLQDNRLIYRLDNGQEMEAATPLEYVEFSGCTGKPASVMFRSGYPNVDQQTAANYYQVLDSGSTQLLKFYKVTYMDQKPYGGASTIRRFDNTVIYYAYNPEAGMVRLGKANDISTKSFGSKQQQLDSYVSAQNLRLKKEDDLIKLFAYYNGLPK